MRVAFSSRWVHFSLVAFENLDDDGDDRIVENTGGDFSIAPTGGDFDEYPDGYMPEDFGFRPRRRVSDG